MSGLSLLKLHQFEMVNPERVVQASADPVNPAHQNCFHARRDFMVQNKIGDEFKVETGPRLFCRQKENFNHAFSKLGNGFFI